MKRVVRHKVIAHKDVDADNARATRGRRRRRSLAPARSRHAVEAKAAKLKAKVYKGELRSRKSSPINSRWHLGKVVRDLE